MGQKGALERVQAPKNTRPRIRRDHRYGYCCLFGAAWHESGGPVIPGNLTLLFLPPYSPELNPMEQVFQFLRGNRFSNRAFAHVEAVRTACEEAWEWLSATPSRIASIMRRQWVATAEADHLATC